MPFEFTSVKETCIYVSDLQRTADFYHHRLGLPIIAQVENRHVFFRAGTSVLLCFIAATTQILTDLPPHGATGSIHFALEITKDDYDTTLEEIQKHTPILHKQTWPNGTRSFYFHDPDHHLVEIVEQNLWD